MDGSWGQVPMGCSAKFGRVPYYKTGTEPPGYGPGCTLSDYQPVCVSHPGMFNIRFYFIFLIDLLFFWTNSCSIIFYFQDTQSIPVPGVYKELTHNGLMSLKLKESVCMTLHVLVSCIHAGMVPHVRHAHKETSNFADMDMKKNIRIVAPPCIRKVSINIIILLNQFFLYHEIYHINFNHILIQPWQRIAPAEKRAALQPIHVTSMKVIVIRIVIARQA